MQLCNLALMQLCSDHALLLVQLLDFQQARLRRPQVEVRVDLGRMTTVSDVAPQLLQ